MREEVDEGGEGEALSAIFLAPLRGEVKLHPKEPKTPLKKDLGNWPC